MSRHRTLSFALLLALGCSSRQPTTTTPTPVAAADAATVAAADAPAQSPWDALDRAGLSRVITEGVARRVREAQPDFDLARLDAHLADIPNAPALAGRTCDALFDLAIVDMANGQNERAERIVRYVRAKARNRNLAFAGTTVLAELKRRGAGADEAAQQRAIEEVFRELPRARFGAATVVFQIFQTQQQLDARVANTRQQLVSPDTARGVLYFSAVMPEIVRNRERFLAAIDTVRTANNARPADPDYRFATVDLANARDAREVRVAVWDLGTNTALFERQLFTNTAEQPNGQDDDHNGQIDDIHGIANDGSAPNTALLYEPPAETLERYVPFLQGIMDLRAGMATTPAAQRVLELQRSVTDAAQLEALESNLDQVGEWSHGTHVAGILLAGNPHARMAVFRSAWAGERRPYHHRGPTDAELDAERANIDAIAEYINRHNIRVVNASLGFSREYVEDELRHERETYRDDDAVRARAEVIQNRRRENWASVFSRCPNTLFVVAAGNSNQDVLEYGEVPAAIDAPNLLVIGAVDRFGNWATFTNSNPERVRVFDHGVEVDSLIPNGNRVPLSGTSMASPNAANLAGKLFALDPALTPQRAITVIAETGDRIAAPFNGVIANETNAVARVRRERRPATPARPAAAPARR